MDKLILIDGNSLLFRAYFAMRPMVTSSGIHTQGIYAFINMLNKIINDYEPSHIAVAFDMKEKTFRHDRYSEYKAGRLQTPIELLAEIPLLHDVLNAMNIKVVELSRYEADDLIGTIAKRASAEGMKTLVISGDKDELQLVDENINVLINRKGMSDFDLYDVAAMKERYNLTPDQFIDLKALMGDKSDNIPGVPGVGEKKGIALLKEYETLENVLEHADEIKGKLGENVRENKEQALMSQWLATINTDSPIEFTWSELEMTEPDIKKLIDIYTQLEFSSFIKKLNIDTNEEMASGSSLNADTAEVSRIRRTDFDEFIKITENNEEICIIVNTDNNHMSKSDISRILMYSSNRMIYSCITPSKNELPTIIRIIAGKQYRLVSYDLKKILYSFIQYADLDFVAYYDIMVAEYLLDANRSKYSIEKMLLRYNSLNVDVSEFDMRENDGPIAAAAVPDEILLKRALYIMLIKDEQSKAMETRELNELFRKCEMPLVMTLADMENSGISVNTDILVSIGNDISRRISELESDIYTAAGTEFNISSPKQLSEVLFVRLAIPYPKQKGSGSYSTAADILDKLKPDYNIVADVLEYRKLSKLRSTYVEGLLALIGDDGKIHPHFQQTVAATGRLSCTEPNLQNIPIRDDYGRLIRKAFVTSNGQYSFTGADYSQIELRILAALSGDDILIQAFNDGKDIHRATAASVFNIPFEEVSNYDRSKAKAVNFGVVYGMSGFGLSENLSISRSEAQKYINDYFDKHNSVKQYLDKQVQLGEENQEVRTYYGRLRQIPEFTSRKFMEREAAKRLAMNTPIQGTAADIIKFAMNSVRNELKINNLKSKLILQIHDELIIEGPDNELSAVSALLQKCMESAAELAVILTVDIHSGKTWYELK